MLPQHSYSRKDFVCSRLAFRKERVGSNAALGRPFCFPCLPVFFF